MTCRNQHAREKELRGSEYAVQGGEDKRGNVGEASIGSNYFIKVSVRAEAGGES
jgi:hypothetical protein